jgi:hypothetical protein
VPQYGTYTKVVVNKNRMPLKAFFMLLGLPHFDDQGYHLDRRANREEKTPEFVQANQSLPKKRIVLHQPTTLQ